MKYLAMIAIVALSFGFLFYQLYWLSFALRGLVFGLVILFLLFVVVKDMK